MACRYLNQIERERVKLIMKRKQIFKSKERESKVNQLIVIKSTFEKFQSELEF